METVKPTILFFFKNFGYKCIVENMENTNTNYMVKYRHKVGPWEKRGDSHKPKFCTQNNICPEFRPL